MARAGVHVLLDRRAGRSRDRARIDRTILVTGGAGHVGSHVVELLVADARQSRDLARQLLTGRAREPRRRRRVSRRPHEGHRPARSRRRRTSSSTSASTRASRRASTTWRPSTTSTSSGRSRVAEFCRRRGVGKLVYAASSTRVRHRGRRSASESVLVHQGDERRPHQRLRALVRPDYAICYFYNAFGPREVGTGTYATLIAEVQRACARRASR